MADTTTPAAPATPAPIPAPNLIDKPLVLSEPWYKNMHIWAVILADTIAVIGVVSKDLPPQYAAILATVAHALFAVDQIIDGTQGK